MKRLRWYDFLTINFFWLGLNIRNNAVGAIFMPLLVDLFVRSEIKNTALGGLRTAGLVIAMLVQPAVGVLSDRSLSRWGRRRPFIVIGVLLDLVFLTWIALSQSYWWLLVGILLLQFSSNLSHGALQGLIPDLVPEDQRGRASGVKAIMELLPLILIAFTISKLVENGFLMWAFFTTGALIFLAMLVTVIFVKEQPQTVAPTEPLAPKMLSVLGMLAGILAGGAAGVLAGGIIGGAGWLIARAALEQHAATGVGVGTGGLMAMIIAVVIGVFAGVRATLGRQAVENRSFTWWVVNRLMFLAAVTSLQGSAPYFLMHTFNITREAAAGMTGTLMMVVGLFTMVTALPSGWLADRIGGRRLLGISGVIAGVGTCVLLANIWQPSQALVYIAGIIVGLGTGLFTTTSWSVGTTIVPEPEAGRFLGISNLAGAGAGMIGAGLGGPVADILNGIVPGMGYYVTFAYFAVLFMLSAVVLRKIR